MVIMTPSSIGRKVPPQQPQQLVPVSTAPAQEENERLKAMLFDVLHQQQQQHQTAQGRAEDERLKAMVYNAVSARDREWERQVMQERQQVAAVIDNITAAVLHERQTQSTTEEVVQQRISAIAERYTADVTEMQQKVLQLTSQATEAVAERDKLLSMQQSQLEAFTHEQVLQEQAHQEQVLQAQLNRHHQQQLAQLNELQQQVLLKQHEIQQYHMQNESPQQSSIVQQGYSQLQLHHSNISRRMGSESTFRSQSGTSLPGIPSSALYSSRQAPLTPEMELHVSRHL